jgi:hypothetical protein
MFKFLCAHPKNGRIVNQLTVAIKWKKKKRKKGANVIQGGLLDFFLNLAWQALYHWDHFLYTGI